MVEFAEVKTMLQTLHKILNHEYYASFLSIKKVSEADYRSFNLLETQIVISLDAKTRKKWYTPELTVKGVCKTDLLFPGCPVGCASCTFDPTTTLSSCSICSVGFGLRADGFCYG